MNKSYSMENLGMDYLVGKKIKSADINSDNDLVVLKTEDETIYLTWNGDCCAHCFIANMSGSENLNDATILEVTSAEWVSTDDGDYSVVDTMGTNMKTSKGHVSFETRVEHNGYYGGGITVNTEAPVGQYSCERKLDPKDLKPLLDF